MSKKKTSNAHKKKQKNAALKKASPSPKAVAQKHTGKSSTKKTVTDKKLPVWAWILIFAVLAAGSVWLFNQEISAVSSKLAGRISVDNAYKLRQEGAFILDVREVSEWVEFHIPESTLIPLGQLEGRLNEVPRDQTVVVVCRSGNRSQEGRDILLAAGFEKVTSMDGGVTDWRDKDYPIVAGP